MEVKVTVNGETVYHGGEEENLVTEMPLTEWAHKEAQKERSYLAFLATIETRMHELLGDTHEYMVNGLENDASSNPWKELYILTRQMHAMADTIGLYRKHTYPPF